MKSIIISVVAVVLLIGGSFFLFRDNQNGSAAQDTSSNVSIVDGKQIIEINAKGGYSPRTTTAKADIPTVLRVKTKGTFDCSAALKIPSIKYKNILPASGNTDINIPSQKSGSTIQGLCYMAMYSFIIKFN